MSSSPVKLKIQSDVARRIRQHARSSMKAEICGVMIGSHDEGTTVVEDCIRGEHSDQGGAHVTFTQDTWEHIYQIKDRDFPDKKIVGWYHSHPGFGIFLSDHDLFIHRNFFSAPHQVAWVYDPHSDEEGCFAMVGEKKVVRLESVEVIESHADADPIIHNEPDLTPEDDEKPDVPIPPPDESSPGAKLFQIFLYLTLAIAAFMSGFMIAAKTLPSQKFMAKLESLPENYSHELVRQVDFLNHLPEGISLLRIEPVMPGKEANATGVMIRRLKRAYRVIRSEKTRNGLLSLAEKAQIAHRLGVLSSGVNVQENLQVRPNQLTHGYTLVIRDKHGIQLISSPLFQDLFKVYWEQENLPTSSAPTDTNATNPYQNATLPRDANASTLDNNRTKPETNGTAP